MDLAYNRVNIFKEKKSTYPHKGHNNF